MAVLPLFFSDTSFKSNDELWLDENTARHIVQVLRMQPGEHLQLTNGKGYVADATIHQAQKKKCSVLIDNVEFKQLAGAAFHLGIAFTKNASRNEWLLEKATELGIRSIIPLVTTRTEREKVRTERLNSILLSALLQSRQFHLPMLRDAMTLNTLLTTHVDTAQKLVAHCIDSKPRTPIAEALQPHKETIILIGPEGDFTQEEVDLCEANGFTGLSINDNRLRTETAAMAVCAYFNLLNHG